MQLEANCYLKFKYTLDEKNRFHSPGEIGLTTPLVAQSDNKMEWQKIRCIWENDVRLEIQRKSTPKKYRNKKSTETNSVS